MSYFDHYYNPSGELTMRGYTRPLDLSIRKFRGWQTRESALPLLARSPIPGALAPQHVSARCRACRHRRRGSRGVGDRGSGGAGERLADLDDMADHLDALPAVWVLPDRDETFLRAVDERLLRSGLLGADEAGLYHG
jgi:hypothetical protein